MTEQSATNQDKDFAQRYARQMIMPLIGAAGQAKLSAATVLLVGVGGLGAPCALYLAAAGVGKLILVDDDRVAISNLQRQIIFVTEDQGKAKVTAAQHRLAGLNPYVGVECVDSMLTVENAERLIAGADIVADGSDNIATRYLVNDTCHRLRKPLVAAAVTGFDGQMTVIRSYHRDNPCYRCLFPAPERDSGGGGGGGGGGGENDVFGDCRGQGVLGPAAGVMGSLQAAEIIKEILGIGESLIGRLVMYDALSTEIRHFTYQKRVGCLCQRT